jgi:hypothetical protein
VKTQEHLWRYTRKSLTDEFGNLTELPGQATEMKNMLQPSLNADGSVMVFVTSPNNLWEGDNIMLVNNWPTHISKPELPANLADQVGATIINPRKTIHAPELVTYSDALKQDLNAEVPSIARNAATSSRKASADLANYQLKVYPNPFISTINIELNRLPTEGAVFTLYDESGKVISQQKINNSLTSLSFPRALAGNYTYQLVDHQGSLISTGKLLKIQ